MRKRPKPVEKSVRLSDYDVTLTGDPDEVELFLQDLQGWRICARVVDGLTDAFHSRAADSGRGVGVLLGRPMRKK